METFQICLIAWLGTWGARPACRGRRQLFLLSLPPLSGGMGVCTHVCTCCHPSQGNDGRARAPCGEGFLTEESHWDLSTHFSKITAIDSW